MENKTIDLPVSIKKGMKLLDIVKHYVYKDISLESNAFFEIHQLYSDDSVESQDTERFEVQYGYPLSGSVCINFDLNFSEKTLCLTGIEVYTQPEDEEFVMASYASSKQFGEVTIKTRGCLDTGTERYRGSSEIDKNPNALLMIDTAIEDLEKAKVLGPTSRSDIVGLPYIVVSSSVSKQR